MSDNPNLTADGAEKFSYPRKVLELGKAAKSSVAYKGLVEVELDSAAKETGNSGIRESKEQVMDLARSLRPGTYFTDRPTVAKTENIKTLHRDVNNRRIIYETESSRARAEADLNVQAQNNQPAIEVQPQETPQPLQAQQRVDRHIIEYRNRVSRDSTNPFGSVVATSTQRSAYEGGRPPSEAISLSQFPRREPSVDISPGGLSPPPRPKVPATMPQVLNTGIGNLQSVQLAHVTDSTGVRGSNTPESESSVGMTAVVPLAAAQHSSTSSGQAQVSYKGKHRRGIAGGSNSGQGQAQTGTFGQPQDFSKAGIDLSIDENEE